MNLPKFLLPLATFLISLGVLLYTMVPTIYGYDSAELMIGAYQLGFVHAPSYPLYLTVAHLFTVLPVGDIAYRVNLFSALSIAGAVPFIYGWLNTIVRQPAIAASTSLIIVWSTYIWSVGLVAEVYAPQVFMVAVLCWQIAHLGRWRVTHPLMIGGWFGLTVAMVPASALLAPGMIAAFLLHRVSMRLAVIAAGLSVAFFLLTLIYFPLRYGHASLEYLTGFDATGAVVDRDLRDPGQIWWVISGQQFDDLFFAEGYLITPRQIINGIRLIFENYLVIGGVLGMIGMGHLFQQERRQFYLWGAFMPLYAYFFFTYGAFDHDVMLAPLYLLWGVFIAGGVAWLVRGSQPLFQRGLLIGVPLFFLLMNFPALNSHGNTETRDTIEAVSAAIPPDTIVMGVWAQISPLLYLQRVEGQRPDLHIIDTHLIETHLPEFLYRAEQPIIYIGDEFPPDVDQRNFRLQEIAEAGELSLCQLTPALSLPPGFYAYRVAAPEDLVFATEAAIPFFPAPYQHLRIENGQLVSSDGQVFATSASRLVRIQTDSKHLYLLTIEQFLYIIEYSDRQ